MPIVASRTISAQNQWTTPIGINGHFNIGIQRGVGFGSPGDTSLGGTIVTVQRSWDNVTYYDVDTWTRSSQDSGFESDLVWYTIGVKTGDYVQSCSVLISVLGSMRS